MADLLAKSVPKKTTRQIYAPSSIQMPKIGNTSGSFATSMHPYLASNQKLSDNPIGYHPMTTKQKKAKVAAMKVQNELKKTQQKMIHLPSANVLAVSSNKRSIVSKSNPPMVKRHGKHLSTTFKPNQRSHFKIYASPSRT